MRHEPSSGVAAEFPEGTGDSREQRPDDLVGTALYCCPDLAGFVSGQTIVVDGGHIMY